MTKGNKDIRTSCEKYQYVIIVERDDVQKYIAKGYGKKLTFDFTVLLNKATKFDKVELAERFIEKMDIQNVIKIAMVKNELSLQ